MPTRWSAMLIAGLLLLGILPGRHSCPGRDIGVLLEEPPHEHHRIHERINRANPHDALDAGEVALDGKRAVPGSIRLPGEGPRTADDDPADPCLPLFRGVGPVILGDGIINGGESRAPVWIAHRDYIVLEKHGEVA